LAGSGWGRLVAVARLECATNEEGEVDVGDPTGCGAV